MVLGFVVCGGLGVFGDGGEGMLDGHGAMCGRGMECRLYSGFVRKGMIDSTVQYEIIFPL